MAAVVMVVGMAAGVMGRAQQVIVSVPVRMPMELQLGGSVITVGQVKDDLFGDTEKFATGASDVTEINLGPNSMGMVGETHGRDGELAKKMKTMVIHTYKYDKPGMYKMEDLDAYRKKLENGNWSCSIHVRNSRGSTDICSRTSSDKTTNEMVIMTAEPQKLTFIHMSGNMSFDELEDMSGDASHDADRIDHRVRVPHSSTPPTPPTPPTPATPSTPATPPSS
jgi:hypothetical protein